MINKLVEISRRVSPTGHVMSLIDSVGKMSLEMKIAYLESLTVRAFRALDPNFKGDFSNVLELIYSQGKVVGTPAHEVREALITITSTVSAFEQHVASCLALHKFANLSSADKEKE